MLELIGDLFFGFLELISYGFFQSSKKTEFEKNIEKLNKEEWFNKLYSDYRYRHMIESKWKITRYLNKKENFELLISDEQARENFIIWVKEEHEIATWGKKKIDK